jgi:hypothetical protein
MHKHLRSIREPGEEMTRPWTLTCSAPVRGRLFLLLGLPTTSNLAEDNQASASLGPSGGEEGG